MAEFDWKAEKVPPAVKLALRVAINHIEPGWDNVKYVLETWLYGELAKALEEE